MDRPDRLVVVLGTGTEVGKTWVTAALIESLRDEVTVEARKPAQSFEPGDGETDAHVLGRASGEAPDTVCPPHRWYDTPMAPPMAAEALRRPSFTIAELVGELRFAPSTDLGIVEGAGGVASPLATDGDNAALADALDPDAVLLVADAGLGTINAVRLCLATLAPERVVVFLNRFDSGNELHRRNRDWMVERDGFALDVTLEALVDRCLGWCRHAPDQIGRS